MKVEIITIGDEILIGQIVDTNSAWMAAALTRSGFEVNAIHSVADSAQDITDAIDLAFSRSGIVLVTGGIGPTNDDITKKTLCGYFDTPLVFSNEVLDNILEIFALRNIALNELTRNQAYVPGNCTVIQNKAGTAPILWFEKEGKVLVSMPGVPFEMKMAMANDVIPRLQSRFRMENYLRQSALVSGITESALAIRLAGFEKELPGGISLAYLPSFGLIKLRLFTRNPGNADEFHRQAEKLKALIADLLVAETEESLEEIVGKKLKAQNLTLSTAESCTGGLVAHKITAVAGASDYFAGGIVCYTNEVKENILRVDKHTLHTFGAVSRQVVMEMAARCAELLGTECALAVSGIAGPSGGTPDNPVGTVWICTYCRGESIAKKYTVGNSRRENMERAANMALLQMLKMIQEQQA